MYKRQVSQYDAIKCIQTALPTDLSDPYALTVASDAVDDQCGSIVVTQRTHHVVVNVQCTIDPGILSEVCRELRTGHRQITQELSKMQHRFDLLQSDMAQLKELVVAGVAKPSHTPEERRQSDNCRKRGCSNIVVGRFANGKKKKQCSSCITLANRYGKKRSANFPS